MKDCCRKAMTEGKEHAYFMAAIAARTAGYNDLVTWCLRNETDAHKELEAASRQSKSRMERGVIKETFKEYLLLVKKLIESRPIWKRGRMVKKPPEGA